MTDSFPRVKAAVVQAAPILFNREASVEKACRLTVEAAAQGARLILFVTKTMYPAGLDGLEELADQPEVMCRGGSTIISPLGEVLAGPLYNQEGTLFADLDLAEVARGKFDFDVVGHYARPDVFQLLVNERATPPVAKKANEEMG